MTQPTQQLKITEFEPENTPTCEYLAYSQLWEFFFQEHNLMLLNEQMDEICHEVDKFKTKFNENKTTSNTDKERPY